MRRLRVTIAATLALALAHAGAAQNTVLTLPADAEDLRAPLEAASTVMSLERDTMDAGGPAPQDYVAAARADYRRLLTALYAAGYYGGTVSITVDGREASALAPLDSPSRIGAVAIRVDPGPRFTFGEAVVAPLPPDTTLPAGFARGEIARSDAVRAAVIAGVDAWRNVGHARAAPAGQDIVADHTRSRLDANVTLDPGRRLTFGPLSVTGNDAVRTERIVAIAGLPAGEVYSPAEIDRAATRLRRTGAFQSVAMFEADTNGPGDTLPVTAQIQEQLPRRLGFGAEVASTQGLTLSAYWLHRNLLGGAERLRVAGEVSGLGGADGGPDYTISAVFGRPATFRADLDLELSGRITRQDKRDYQLDLAEVELALVRYVNEEFTLSGGPGLITAHEVTPYRDRRYTLLTFPVRGTLDRRDNALDATSGYYLDLELTPFLGLDGVDHGLRAYADARAYRSFGEGDRVTLAARGQFGSVIGADPLDAPADYLFYSGGGGTVRGQPYRSLGVSLAGELPGAAEDARIGGASFAGAQIEARVGVTDSIGVVGFYDTGFIDSEPFPSATGEWHAGAGIGLRYDTGFGPIRLDLATPASGDDAGKRLEVYIGIGQAF